MDKKFLMISSVDDEYNKNSLSSFTNTIPRGYLPTNKKWKVSVESIGFNARFVNAGVSKNNQFPALIQINRANFRQLQSSNSIEAFKLKLSDFQHHNLFY